MEAEFGIARGRAARQAGALYLVIIVLGIWGEVFVRAGMVAPGDAEATAAAIRAGETLFRLGIAADAVMALCDVGLAVLLFAIFAADGAALALGAMVFRLVQAAVIGANLGNLDGALAAAAGAEPAVALRLMDAHGAGYDFALVFFGMSCLLLGALILRSARLPRPIGFGIMAAGAVYLAGSFLRFTAPGLWEAFLPAYAVPLLAETALCLWLLARGVRTGGPASRARPAGS